MLRDLKKIASDFVLFLTLLILGFLLAGSALILVFSRMPWGVS